jgi:pimeloyl-ACP methyl ester carboxylesterase
MMFSSPKRAKPWRQPVRLPQSNGGEPDGSGNPEYFGSSTGAAAALVAAASLGEQVAVVVSRGGRPDLAGASLAKVKASTLLIVGGHDEPVIRLNWDAYGRLLCEKRVEIVERATHLFEEPGTLEEVARLAADWFTKHFELEARAVGS